MSVSLKPVYSKFKVVAHKYVGSMLNTYSDDIPELSAIYSKKDPNKIGRYPFITVNITNISSTEDRSLYEWYNDNDELVTVFNEDLLITYAVFSTHKTTHSAEQIAFDLKARLNTRAVRAEFSDIGEVVEVFPVSSTETHRDGGVVEVAAFNMRFTVYSEVVDIENYLINRVDADLHLKYDESETEDVASATISVTKP